jgi:hypothetical protein
LRGDRPHHFAFRAPDGWGLTVEPPGPGLADEIGAVPDYLLDEAEADWPALLDILLVCVDLEPWPRAIVVQRHASERQARKIRNAQCYGVGESAAFERLLRGTVAGAMDDHVAAPDMKGATFDLVRAGP